VIHSYQNNINLMFPAWRQTLGREANTMARENGKPGGVGRREFIAGAGVFVTGTVSTLAVGAPIACKSGASHPCKVLLHDPTACAGCGTCAMMCSLYHEGEVGPVLSRSTIDRDPFNYDFTFNVCQQCYFPDCYFACPLKDTARLLDDETGIVYVDEDECIGCGSCVAACRFDPPRTTLHPVKGVALNCDRCMDRDEGPICVAYCTMDALSCATIRPPRRSGGRRG
jgi:Fe-S-cluster-containing dehydrogenase component